jgi:hypothetical protein
LRAFDRELRELDVLLEGRGDAVAAVGERDPQLQAFDERRLAQGELGVRDTRAARHEIELAGPQHDLRAEAVAVADLALDRPRDGLEAGVRVGEDLHVGVLGPELVEEAPGADRGDLALRQSAADLHRADAAERHVPRLEECGLRPGGVGGPARRFRGVDLEIAHAVTLARAAGVGPDPRCREW